MPHPLVVQQSVLRNRDVPSPLGYEIRYQRPELRRWWGFSGTLTASVSAPSHISMLSCSPPCQRNRRKLL
jgi:hypothetical protein